MNIKITKIKYHWDNFIFLTNCWSKEFKAFFLKKKNIVKGHLYHYNPKKIKHQFRGLFIFLL
jgi:hypothetical protein